MVLHSTRWLALSYFTYFFSYGIFLPFWSVWLKGIGLTPETIGVLLGAGLVARFLGSLLIAPRVSDPSLLIKAVRILALLTLVFAACFWVNNTFAWLMVVMVGFNLFFSPLVPLTDALANTWQKQITMDYGRVRLWGSIAFVIGSALVGKLVSLYDYHAILALLSLGIASMLLGMLLRPSVMPQGESRHQESAGWPAWRSLVTQSWRFLACVCLLQGAHDAHCGCGHQHLPTQEQLQNGDDWRARLMIVLSMGMRPCSGAIMVLLFSKVIGVFGWGMLSALAMAAGTSLTISSLALLVHSFRQLAVKLSGNKTPVLWRQIGWTTLALAGGVILLVAAITMWMSAVPVGRGLRPF
jgi:ABC-type uncharacterized transport system, permease component